MASNRHLAFLACLFSCALLISKVPSAQASALSEGITGTFILPDIQITDQSTMDTYLDGMKAIGIDTVIWNYTGVVYYGDRGTLEDCSASNVVEDNYFTDNRLNYLENADKLLTSVKNKNMFIYIGLAGNASCYKWWQGDPSTPGTGSYNIIDLSRRLILDYQNLCNSKGWTCDFVKGFYISEEQALYALNWPGDDTFYIAMSHMIKSLVPSKRILLSPYQYESTDYRTTYDSVYWLLENTSVDTISPQDTMGTGYVTTYDTDSTHYLAMHDAVADINTKYPNKHAEVWANIESFQQSGRSDVVFAPTSYAKLYQQMSAVDQFVTKKITWIYSWSLANDDFLRNYGAKTQFYEYSPAYADQRQLLRQEYSAAFFHVPGDLTGEGRVDLQDYNMLVSGYSTLYTLSDYNALVANYGI